MIRIGEVGWIEKEKPTAGIYDAIVKPLAVAPYQIYIQFLRCNW